MTHELVTVATFGTAPEAALARNLLESEGIRAFLADEATISTLWHYGNTLGWIKLQVAAEDAERAGSLLEEQKANPAAIDAESLAAAALHTDDQEANGETPRFDDHGADEDFADEPDLPGDALAARALRASVVAFLFAPLSVYAAWLIVRCLFSADERSPRATRNLWLACAFTAAFWAVYGTFFLALAGTFDSPSYRDVYFEE